jgi:hypothetical protein
MDGGHVNDRKEDHAIDETRGTETVAELKNVRPDVERCRIWGGEVSGSGLNADSTQ